MDEKELIIQLKEEIKFLKRKVNSYHETSEKISKYGGTTTKSERQQMSNHVEQLDKLIKAQSKPKQKIKALPPNTFEVGQIVELINNFSETYRKGIIKYIACRDALPSVRTCDRKVCVHKTKEFVWVDWPNGKSISYSYLKLLLMSPSDLLPKIGTELSGKIGPWEFNATTRKWKKEGKEYTEQEFSDIMYWEAHPYDKEDGEHFLKFFKLKSKS